MAPTESEPRTFRQTSRVASWPRNQALLKPVRQSTSTLLNQSMGSAITTAHVPASVLAWQRHVKTLTADEKSRFLALAKAQGDVVSFVEDAKKLSDSQRENSLSHKVAMSFEPIFQFMRLYMPVAQTIVQADPNPSALVLGGIVCIIQISSNYLQFQQKISDALYGMGRKLATAMEFGDDLYSFDDKVQEALIELCGDILDFCQGALSFLVTNEGTMRNRSKLFLTSLLQPFDSKLGLFIKSFDNHLKDFKFRVELSSQRMSRRFDKAIMLGQRHDRDMLQYIMEMSEGFSHGIGQQQIDEQTRRESERRLRTGTSM